MQSSLSLPRLRRALLFMAACALAAGYGNAQSAPAAGPLSAAPLLPGESSSDAGMLADAFPAGAASPSAHDPAASTASQENGGYGRQGGYRGHTWSGMEFEAGGGFNAPTNESSPYITWGGNLTVGAGLRFSPVLSALIEYQFIDSKLPGHLIAEAGADGGHDHIWSLTIDPVVDLFPKSSNDIYLTGGGGFYRKVTIFTDILPSEFCTYFFCGIGYSPQTVGHFSSNQGGWSVGGGFQHRLGGLYGESKTRIFAEARYLDVESPAITTQPNGLGTTTVGPGTKIVPVTFGVRF